MRMQFDANGEEITTDINVELEAPDRTAQGGAQAFDVSAFNKTMRETAEKIRDPRKIERISEQHEINIGRYEDLDTIIGNLEDGGRPVPQTMREERMQLRIQLELSHSQLKAATDG